MNLNIKFPIATIVVIWWSRVQTLNIYPHLKAFRVWKMAVDSYTFFLLRPCKFTLDPSSSTAFIQCGKISWILFLIQEYLGLSNFSSSADRFVCIVAWKYRIIIQKIFDSQPIIILWSTHISNLFISPWILKNNASLRIREFSSGFV